MTRNRLAAVMLIGLAATTASAVYVLRSARQAGVSAALPSGVVTDQRQLTDLLSRPHALFRSTRLGDGYGHVVASTIDPGGIRLQTGLECDRVDAVTAAGVCLTAERGVLTRYWAVTFDAALQPHHRIELAGIPSRVRLSPDGRFAGITVFVSGHGYSNAEFSTSTIILDVTAGTIVADLEQFAVSRNGQPFKNANFNFWGVTFTGDSNRFYATLGSGAELFLIKGETSGRAAEVIAEGVECPSLSPDNQRIAFKKRIEGGGRLGWRLAILDLATLTEQVIEREPASVDDQPEWLDDHDLVYAVPDATPGNGGTSVHIIDIRTGSPSVWAAGAYSPAIVAAVASHSGS